MLLDTDADGIVAVEQARRPTACARISHNGVSKTFAMTLMVIERA